MLGHQHAQPGAQLARGQQRDQRDQRGEHDQGLRDAAPLAAEQPQCIADRGRREQEQARGEQGGGMEDDLARDVDVQPPVGHACGGDRDERHHQRVSPAARGPPRVLEPAEQQRVGVERDVERGERREREAQVLDRPAPALGGVAVDLLDAQQAQHARDQRGAEVLLRAQFRERGEPLQERDDRGEHQAAGDRPRVRGAAQHRQQEHRPRHRTQRLGAERERPRRRRRGQRGRHRGGPGRLQHDRRDQHATEAACAAAHGQQERQRRPREGGGGVSDQPRERHAVQRAPFPSSTTCTVSTITIRSRNSEWFLT